MKPVSVQEDRAVDLDVGGDPAGRRNAVEVRVLIQHADERLLDIRDEFGLTGRARLPLEPRL
jgi:hypothetical protein